MDFIMHFVNMSSHRYLLDECICQGIYSTRICVIIVRLRERLCTRLYAIIAINITYIWIYKKCFVLQIGLCISYVYLCVCNSFASHVDAIVQRFLLHSCNCV